MTGYIYLALGIFVEVFGTIMIKLANGFTNMLYSAGCLFFYALTFFCLSRASQHLSLSLVYGTSSAMVLICTAICDYLFFNEKLTHIGLIGGILTIVGIVLINVYGYVE